VDTLVERNRRKEYTGKNSGEALEENAAMTALGQLACQEIDQLPYRPQTHFRQIKNRQKLIFEPLHLL
jgi:hypothetical protein